MNAGIRSVYSASATMLALLGLLESHLSYRAKPKVEAFREVHLGIERERSWKEAVVRYLSGKQQLRSFKDIQRICRHLDPHVDSLTLREINVVASPGRYELRRDRDEERDVSPCRSW